MHISLLLLYIILHYPLLILSNICYVFDFPTNKLKTSQCDGKCIFGYYYNKTQEKDLYLHACLPEEMKSAVDNQDYTFLSKLHYCNDNGIYRNFFNFYLTDTVFCCNSDYCNNPYAINCYISIGSLDNWQENEFKFEQHFPLKTCTQLFFTLDYQQLSFRHFISETKHFQEHLDSLSTNTRLFIEMLKIVKEKMEYKLLMFELGKQQLKLIFSIGTTNNPSNHNALRKQIEEDFNLVTQSSENQQLFAQNCMFFLERFDLDGIDIAHGYPDMNATVQIFQFFKEEATMEIYRQLTKMDKYLTLFPAPSSNIRNITSQVENDNGYFYEFKNKVNVKMTVFYDYAEMVDFMKGYRNMPLFEIIFGVKFKHFTGTTYKELFYLPEQNRQELLDIQQMVNDASLSNGISVMFLDWDIHTESGPKLLGLVKNSLLNQTGPILTIGENETLQKEIVDNLNVEKEKLEREKRIFPLGGLIIALFVLFLVLVLIILFFIGVDDDDAIPFDEMPEDFVEKGLDLNGKNFSLKKRKRLGEGSFGTVFLAKYTGPSNLEFDSGRLKASLLIEIGQFACKIVKITQEGGVDHVLQEFTTLKECQHEHIVRAFGVILLRRQIAIVMEFMPFGDLHKYLRTIGKKENQKQPQIKQCPPIEASTKIASLDECSSSLLPATSQIAGNDEELPLLEDIHSWMLCVIKAVKYLHGKNILHRDLAARNCLFMDEQRKLLKLGDFGLARFAIDYDKKYECAKDKPVAWPWMAKELVFSEEKTIAFTKASDVWSFGVLVWEMCSRGAKPYDAEPGDMERVKSWLERLRPLQCPPLARYDLINEHILKTCFSAENQRPKFVELEGILLSLIRGQIPIKRKIVINPNVMSENAGTFVSPILISSTSKDGSSNAKSARKDDSMAIIMEKLISIDSTAVDMFSLLDKQEYLTLNAKEMLIEKMDTFKSAVQEIVDGKKNADEENSNDSDEISFKSAFNYHNSSEGAEFKADVETKLEEKTKVPYSKE